MKNPEKDFEAIKQREYKVVKHNALIESVVPYMDKVTKQKHILKAVEQRAVNFILSLISIFIIPLFYFFELSFQIKNLSQNLR